METGSRFAFARWLVEQRGLSVIPLRPRAKKALTAWTAFQYARPGLSNLTAWFDNDRDHNLGIVCGAISGVVAVDCDSPAAIAWAAAHLPPTPMITKTAKGEHWFYRHPGVAVRNTVKLPTDDAAAVIDVRGDGGYVVGPPSVHPTGAIYTPEGTWPPVAELPAFDPAWLARANARNDAEGAFLRAQRYLAAVPPAIEGQGGDAHTYRVCCKLVRGFALTDRHALTLLRAWNRQCVPPWSDADLRDKIRGARLYGEEPYGGRRDAGHRGPSDGTPADSAPLVSLTLHALSTHVFAPRKPLLWRGDTVVLRAGYLAEIYAERGFGKTWFVQTLGLVAAGGGTALGFRADAPVRVLHVDGEMASHELKDRYALMRNHLQIPTSAPLTLVAADWQDAFLPRLDTPAGQDALDPFIETADLVIIDNRSCLFDPEGEKDPTRWQPAQDWLLSLRRRGKAVILAHHSNRQGRRARPFQGRGPDEPVDQIDAPGRLQPRPRRALRGDVRKKSRRLRPPSWPISTATAGR